MYNQSFWNDRYTNDDYLYGTEPNTFLAEHCHQLSNPVLSLAEGEGRNAVFLASVGLDVLGVDLSGVGLKKAQKLAELQGVKIKTEVADLGVFTPQESYFGSVVSIFAHLPSKIRQRLYPLIEKTLKPNGIIILEAYSENQLLRTTGGPKSADLLMTVAKLNQEFLNLEFLLLREVEREVCEGQGHRGRASVIQFIGRKKP